MAEVLAKVEKYINGEEALCQSGEALPRERRKPRAIKSGIEASREEETEINLHGGAGKTKIDLQREEVMSGTAWVHPIPSCSRGTHLNSSPP